MIIEELIMRLEDITIMLLEQ